MTTNYLRMTGASVTHEYEPQKLSQHEHLSAMSTAKRLLSIARKVASLPFARPIGISTSSMLEGAFLKVIAAVHERENFWPSSSMQYIGLRDNIHQDLGGRLIAVSCLYLVSDLSKVGDSTKVTALDQRQEDKRKGGRRRHVAAAWEGLSVQWALKPCCTRQREREQNSTLWNPGLGMTENRLHKKQQEI